ncbi:MAG: UDP-N-acetylglucosamine--N-acetylmuramyl-(pentapeptide) pyrophosphoryl-undecaprenol N-acetylglucosamine transferase [Pseudomonadota bacterium]
MPELEKPLVVIAAGGTGGHMFPAAAFAEEMASRGWAVGLVSDERGLHYASKFPADWKEEVAAASPNVRKPWTLPGAFAKINRGLAQARGLIRDKKPALAAGFGGYPAFPLLAAARRQALPILIHEQNSVLGRVNRQMARHAAVIACGFDRLDLLPAAQADKKITVGNPVRAPIAAMREAPYPPTDGPLNMLITGGSQGARILGQALPLAITELPDTLKTRLKVVQQVREEQILDVVQTYARAEIEAEVETFFSDMPERLRDAHLVIARSGAGTVSELAAVGRPSILIPLAIAMNDHQTANAAALVDAGAADMVVESNLYPDLISELIRVRLEDGEDLRARAAKAKAAGTVTAAKDLADIAEGVAKG